MCCAVMKTDGRNHPGEVRIAYELPKPMIDSLCSGFGRSDGLQLSLVQERERWMVSRVAVGPC